MSCSVNMHYHNVNVVSVILNTVGGRSNGLLTQCIWVWYISQMDSKLKSSRSRCQAPLFFYFLNGNPGVGVVRAGQYGRKLNIIN